MKYSTDIQRRREKKILELQKNGKYLEANHNNYLFDEEEFERVFKKRLFIRSIISFILIILVYLIFKTTSPYAEMSQKYIYDALTRDFNFQGVYSIYIEKFTGNPAILPTFDIIKKESQRDSFNSPLKGLPLQIDKNGYGIFIKTTENEQIVALDKGLITKTGKTEKMGSTVTIKHQNGIESTYAMLNEISVEKDDWVEEGQIIGTVKDKLYITIKNQEKYLNPLDVIIFD